MRRIALLLCAALATGCTYVTEVHEGGPAASPGEPPALVGDGDEEDRGEPWWPHSCGSTGIWFDGYEFDYACPDDALAQSHFNGAIVANEPMSVQMRACMEDPEYAVSLHTLRGFDEHTFLTGGTLRFGEQTYTVADGWLEVSENPGPGGVLVATFNATFVSVEGGGADWYASGEILACTLPRYLSPWGEGEGECSADVPCPDTGWPCDEAHCVDGRCEVVPANFGEVVPDEFQQPADCHLYACDEHGSFDLSFDPEDAWDDDNECTFEWCDPDGFFQGMPLETGTPCAQGAGSCDGDGQCVIP